MKCTHHKEQKLGPQRVPDFNGNMDMDLYMIYYRLININLHKVYILYVCGGGKKVRKREGKEPQLCNEFSFRFING